MKNKLFIRLSIEEKRNKLRDAIRSHINDTMSLDEISHILHSIPVEVQYKIVVHNDDRTFLKAVSSAGQARVRMLLGDIAGGGAEKGLHSSYSEKSAALIHCWPIAAQKNSIHIYIPPKHNKSETEEADEKRPQPAACS